MGFRWAKWVLLVIMASTAVQAETKSGITVSSGVTTLNADWLRSNNSGVDRMLYFGVAAGLYSKFIHFTIDGYYGTASASSQSQTGASLEQFGGLAILGVHAPLYTGQVLFQPHLGIGYGLMGLSYGGTFSTQIASVPLASQELLHGGVIQGGLTVEPWHWLIVYGDYNFSLFASSNRTASAPSLSVPLPNSGAGFDRIRAGLAFRLGSGILLGGQFVQRTSHFAILGKAGAITPVQQQYLGTLGLEF